MTFVDVGAIRRRTERLTSPRRFGRRSAKKRRERSPLSPTAVKRRDSTESLGKETFLLSDALLLRENATVFLHRQLCTEF